MTQELRKKTILKLLEQNNEVSIQNFVAQCNVSEITVRRDLTLLEKEKVCSKELMEEPFE